MALNQAKMVVSDIDGTLITKERVLTAFTLETIQKLKQRGILFATLSARSKSNSEMFFTKHLALCDAQGYVNGAYVNADNQPILDEWIDAQIISELCNKLNRLDVSYCCVSVNDASAVIRHEFCRERFHHFYKGYRELESGMPINHKTYLIVMVGELGTLHSLTDYIQQNAPFIDSSPAMGPFNDSIGVQFIQRATVDKGKAIGRISKHYSIPLEQIMAFGDGIINDLPMFKKAGKAVAMKNANEELKDHAHDITPYDNNQDGVARYLIDYFGLG